MGDFKISNFKLVRRLGAGAFGEIFQAVDLKTNQEVAIKFEKTSTQVPQLFFEAKLLQYLLTDPNWSERGLPRIHCYRTEGAHNVMVMDLLGPSLEDLFNVCNRKFSLKTVLMLGMQMLARIEYVHLKYILHRDIKPDNFVVGQGTQKHRVYLIDFGLAKKYVTRDGKHIPYKEGKSLTGTARYASINTHLGIEQARRDDLESLGFVLMYFLRGSLPWQNMTANNKKEKYEKIMKKKLETPVEVLCKGFPQEFMAYFSYCRNLKFEDKPDYSCLKNLFQELLIKSGFLNDNQFDWNVIARKKKEEKKEPEVKEIEKMDLDPTPPIVQKPLNDAEVAKQLEPNDKVLR